MRQHSDYRERTTEEIKQHVKEDHPWVKEWTEGVCAHCVGKPTGGVVEDLYDGICRYCQCEEERPTDPAELPPSLRASRAEWRAWLYGRLPEFRDWMKGTETIQ